MAETPGEKLYEQWDCPQVIAKYEYKTCEPDTLYLEVGDVINVTRKSDGKIYYIMVYLNFSNCFRTFLYCIFSSDRLVLR